MNRLGRRWLLGACVLAMTTGAAAQSSPSRSGAPAQPPPERNANAPNSPAQAHGRWLAALGGLAAVVGLLVLAARRRLASPAGASYAENWQGIGGSSYAPRPTTIRIEPRSAQRQDSTRDNEPPPSVQQPENLRRPFGVPDDFDTPAFLDSAKQSFMRLQSAWDRSDLKELDACTTEEMFSALTHELRVRAGPSQTEVIGLTASLLGMQTAAGEHRASVRFRGNLRVNGEDERLDEVWSLSKPVDSSSGWLLAGIQQLN